MTAPRPTRRRALLASEEGSTLPLVLGAVALALSLVLVVVAAASLYLEHKRLLGLADAAARVGAESFDLAAVTVDEHGVLRVGLDGESVHDAVADFLRHHPTPPDGPVDLEEATTLDGRSATVTLSSWWRPPLVGPLLPEGLRVAATSTARTVFH